MAVSTYNFPGRYSSLSAISEIVKEKSSEAGLQEDSIYSVECAVDEACSNIIEHAYRGEDNGEILVELEVFSKGIKIRLIDHGIPFQPEKIGSPDLKAPLSKRKPSGLGLFMMRKCMDEVSFDFSPEANTLTMTKYRDTPCCTNQDSNQDS
jgi:serine/threonine-protein kinase RsbW